MSRNSRRRDLRFVVASEIGPDFSPDIVIANESGLYPLGYAFLSLALLPSGEKGIYMG